ncbi:MAG: UDP-N-acetylmuramate--L-alanine ligase [Ignavibacteria bacterium]|nr:UDP-N-acetylmuramate--L-alanine ligase [Ignavibacteria bacterium]
MIPITILMKKNSIYFVGIGGIGMSGLAEYYLKNGSSVYGSDMTETAITTRLRELGAKIYIGHNAENINSTIDTVVYTSAVKSDNHEIIRAKELGLRTIRRAEMLGEIVNDKYLIAVSGTHGKTTTTAMIGKLLVDAGLDPLIFVGGNVQLFDGGASRFGSGKYAVVEADEYDRSFLTLRPNVTVITNVDEDHLDIYKDLDDIKDTFRLFCDRSKYGAYMIFCGDDGNIKSFINSINREKISYGFDEKNYLKIIDYNAENNALNFSILNSHSSYNDIKLNMVGKHNALNSTACFAVSKVLDIPLEKYRESISNFRTVDRRMQLKYESNGIKVYDDYSHHQVEVSASLNGLREMVSGRIITVFQPHLYSRTRDFYKEFAESLAVSDKVLLMDIYPAREKPIEGVTSKLIFDELIKLNKNSKLAGNSEDIINMLIEDRSNNDVIVFQGAGDVTNLCSKFVKKLESDKKN